MKKNVLVVDNDVDILDIVSFIVEDNGYSVIKSEHAEVLNDICDIDLDLIILDNYIGTVSGSELCKKLKSDPRHRHIPVILMSAIEELEEAARICKADGFLRKPFNIAELEAVLNSTLRS